MKIKKLFTTVIVATLSLSLFACSEETSKKTSDKGGKNLESSTVACYLNKCYEPVPLSPVTDADYIYPDPNGFGDSSLRPQYRAPNYAIDLQNADPLTPLSKNFKLRDFMSKEKGRYGLFSSFVAQTLQLIRNEVAVPVHLHSGYRSPGYNRRLDGSAKWSRHTYGDAVDFHIEGKSIAELPKYCEEHGASFTLKYQTHIHCDWRKHKLDPAFYEDLGSFGLQADTTPPAKLIAQQSRILYHDNGQFIQFDSEIALDEEEGLPVFEWYVQLPNGESLASEEVTFQVPRMQGKYHVRLVVGGSIKLEIEFTR